MSLGTAINLSQNYNTNNIMECLLHNRRMLPKYFPHVGLFNFHNTLWNKYSYYPNFINFIEIEAQSFYNT